MEITRRAKPVRNMEDVNIWHCRGCGVVHMSVGKKVLNFSRDEFAEFTKTVVDLNFSGWPVGGGSVFDLTDHDAETYVNAFVQ